MYIYSVVFIFSFKERALNFIKASAPSDLPIRYMNSSSPNLSIVIEVGTEIFLLLVILGLDFNWFSLSNIFIKTARLETPDSSLLTLLQYEQLLIRIRRAEVLR